jgi:hypothetical protein
MSVWGGLSWSSDQDLLPGFSPGVDLLRTARFRVAGRLCVGWATVRVGPLRHVPEIGDLVPIVARLMNNRDVLADALEREVRD